MQVPTKERVRRHESWKRPHREFLQPRAAAPRTRGAGLPPLDRRREIRLQGRRL